MGSVTVGSFSQSPVVPLQQANSLVEQGPGKLTDIIARQQQTDAESFADTSKEVTPEQLGKAVESINQFVSAEMRTLNFSVDENSGKAVVKVIDFETKDVIRQIPGEEVLRMASAIQRLQEDLGSATGLLIDKKV